MRKLPHTGVWIMLVRGLYETEAVQSIAKAPAKVLNTMLDQMMAEGPEPVWDALVAERGDPLEPDGWQDIIIEPKTGQDIPREVLDAQLGLYAHGLKGAYPDDDPS